jgi:hypothetical protein
MSAANSQDAGAAPAQGVSDTKEDGKDATNPETGEATPDGGAANGDPADDILKKIVSFRPFTKESYKRLVEQEASDKAKAARKKSKAQEAHLVDGELIFGEGEDPGEEAIPERNPDLREGLVLREEYGVFPPSYIGKPLEEIDKGIRDKVSSHAST